MRPGRPINTRDVEKAARKKLEERATGRRRGRIPGSHPSDLAATIGGARPRRIHRIAHLLRGMIKAAKKQTGERYSVVEILAPDSYGSVLHVHHQEDEGFHILEGEMTFYVGDQIIKARPGSYLFGPRDVPHAFTVDSGPARLLFIFSPAGLEGLIREMGEPARSLTVPPQPDEEPDEAELERMAAIGARYGAETLGPPPGQ
jgi:mannose-6-phosphate isomerase-like protein (cupin superfamily)